MQTILGAGGAIGSELANALAEYTKEIRLVGRNPKKINESDEVFQADLLNAALVLDAVKGSSVVYLTAGLTYAAQVWKRDWPIIMANVINACTKHNARLVFFDNMYMYDPSQLGIMTERTPVKPSSDKGKVRAQINQMIFDEMDKGKLSALIARCADYYGPGDINTSMLYQTVIKPLSNGKKANWLGGVNYKHSMTYTIDAGKATALLGNTPDAFNQIWHLPTAPDPLTGKQWIDAIANELGVEPKFQVASKMIVRGLGLFMPIMKEMVEMYYQFDRDYVFNSSKIENRFSIKPTPYDVGIKAAVGK
jgi:nucleoside-diphosphate-sugar epimerase